MTTLTFTSFPTEGIVGVASTSFTVASIGGNVSTAIVVTPNDTGDTGVFSPTSVTLNTGNQSATFTYTPTTVGVKSIQVSNDHSLANPSQIAYMAKAKTTAISFDNALATILSYCTTKTTYSSAIQTALGNTRVVKIYRDGSGGANPYSSGIKVYEVANTGALTIIGGNITSFGLCSTVAQRSAVDLTSGTSCLRIEGNGHWMQGSLGLVGSSSDFTLPSSLTGSTSEGFGFGAAVLNAVAQLPSGTGPAIPATNADTPYTVTIEDWTTGLAIVAGSANFDHRISDFVYEDADVAAEIGDVAVYQSTQSITFGSFEFGIMLLRSAASNTVIGNIPLEQVLVCCKPMAITGWTSYPAMDTYNSSTMSTYPGAFKVKIKRADQTVLGTLQMHDGLAINDPSLPQNFDATHALRPHWNCGMMLPWQNTAVAPSSRRTKYFNGVAAETIRDSQSKQQASFLANIPLASDGYSSQNSMNHWFALRQWPGVYANIPRDSTPDPYLFDPNAGSTPYFSYATGWGYEPGSISGHDWFSGPGGPRSDRYTLPMVLAIWGTNNNFVRLEGNIPIRTMVDAWGMAHFNHSNHWVTNVKTFSSIPDPDSLSGNWVYAHAYYGGGPYYNGAYRTIDLKGVGAGSMRTAANNDASGRMPWGGWSDNSLHSYSNPGWFSLLFNSPMHTIADKFKFNNQWMSALGDSAPTANPVGYFMIRIQAWRYLHYCMSWKLASKHALGQTRSNIESRLQIELEQLYTSLYVPAFVSNATDILSTCIRNLGCNYTNQYTYLTTGGGNLAFYLGHTLQMWKVTGLWAKMKAMSTKCSLALDMLIYCLDKQSVDYILDTDGWFWNNYTQITATQANGYAWTSADIPTSWANWSTIMPKPNAASDWIHDSTGTIIGTFEWDTGMHLKAQWPAIHQTFFPEYANPRLAAAVTKFQGYYDQITARVNAASGAANKRLADWTYRTASMGVLNATT